MGAVWHGQGVAWAAPGRRGALLAGFIALMLERQAVRSRGEPGASLKWLWRQEGQGWRQVVPVGSTGSRQHSEPTAVREPGVPQGARCPSLQ